MYINLIAVLWQQLIVASVSQACQEGSIVSGYVPRTYVSVRALNGQ